VSRHDRSIDFKQDRDIYHFGGYPWGAPFAGDEAAWKRYITDSLIETVKL
jgi:hypothetical protein